MPSSPTLSTPTRYITAGNGVRFAYRTLGHPLTAGVPLVMHMHFRGNMDFWDPLLLDPLAAERSVLIFDQAGVGRSSGEVATTMQGWADNLLTLLDALELTRIDLLGFSMGGMAVQQVALTRPELIRRLILAGTESSRPSPAEVGKGIVWPRESSPEGPFKALHGAYEHDMKQVTDAIAVSFFPPTDEGRAACRAYRERIKLREVPNEQSMLGFLGRTGTDRQAKASGRWSLKYVKEQAFDRLEELKMPVLVVNGDDDVLIPTSRSWEMAKKIENATLIIYPRAGHGFLWQYAPRFARDINSFLADSWPGAPGAKL